MGPAWREHLRYDTTMASRTGVGAGCVARGARVSVGRPCSRKAKTWRAKRWGQFWFGYAKAYRPFGGPLVEEINPYAAPSTRNERADRAVVAPSTLALAVRRGAWLGWKWGNYVAAAYAVLAIIAVMAGMGWRLAAGKRLRFPAVEEASFMLLIPVACYLEICIYGVIVGAVIAARNYRRSRRVAPRYGRRGDMAESHLARPTWGDLPGSPTLAALEPASR
jgi:hypothetical protein